MRTCCQQLQKGGICCQVRSKFLSKILDQLDLVISDENDVVSNYFMKKEKRNGLLAVFNGIKESILPTRTKKAF